MEGLNRIHLAQDRYQCQVLVDSEMKLQVL
jgi:hypothetical protein